MNSKYVIKFLINLFQDKKNNKRFKQIHNDLIRLFFFPRPTFIAKFTSRLSKN